MVITYHGGNIIRGTAADRTGGTWTNLVTGYLFVESDTQLIYYWNGSTWSPTKTTNSDVAKVNTDSPYTITATDQIIRTDATSGNITLNLPTASGIAGRTYTIIRTDILASTNLVTIDASSTETIDGSLTHILHPAETVVIESNGTNWISLTRTQPSLRGYYFVKGSTANRRYVAGASGIGAAYSASTTSPAANTLVCTPLHVAKTTKFDLISFRVNTLGSGNARVGIYKDNGNSFPGALIFDSGSIDTTTGSTSVVRDTTITSSLQIFQAGLYWLAFETDSATGQYSTPVAATTMLGFAGSDNAMGSINPGFAYTVAHTFGALPDPYTTSATIVTTSPAVGTPIVAVGLRPI